MLVSEQADDFSVRCDVGAPRDDASRAHPAAKGTTRSKSGREKRKHLSMRREAGGKEQSGGARLRSELEVLLRGDRDGCPHLLRQVDLLEFPGAKGIVPLFVLLT
jgi:hypothetical protein